VTNPDGWVLLEDQLECLKEEAKRRYEVNTHREPWQDQEARWHIYKATDQLAIASYHYRQDSPEAYQVNMADALNHMVMAMVTFTQDPDGCLPVMDDD
jgi:hypothetical protein